MQRTVLIVGAGIAGLTLADLLEQAGWQVTVIEKAPALQTGGYMIDFFGPGFTVAKKMGILPALKAKHVPVTEMHFINRQGTRIRSVDIEKSRARAQFRHFNFLRGDLEEVLYERARTGVSIRYGVTVTAMRQDPNAVAVTLSDGSVGSFDIVVGADGLHSAVRELVFGPLSSFERYLGYMNFAYIIPHAARQLHALIAYLAPNQLSVVYPISATHAATSFVFRAKMRLPLLSRAEQADVFHREFSDLPDLLARAAKEFDAVPAPYFGPFTQIRMPSWHKGRAALLGDAAHCVSPIAGQGASLAMYGAYTLAKSLTEHSAIPDAFGAYDRHMRGGVARQQKNAERFARWFLPKSKLGAAVAVRLIPFFLRNIFKGAIDAKL